MRKVHATIFSCSRFNCEIWRRMRLWLSCPGVLYNSNGWFSSKQRDWILSNLKKVEEVGEVLKCWNQKLPWELVGWDLKHSHLCNASKLQPNQNCTSLKNLMLWNARRRRYTKNKKKEKKRRRWEKPFTFISSLDTKVTITVNCIFHHERAFHTKRKSPWNIMWEKLRRMESKKNKRKKIPMKVIEARK